MMIFFFAVRCAQLSAQFASLYLLTTINFLCSVTPLDQLLSAAHTECATILDKTPMNVVHLRNVRHENLFKSAIVETESKVERLKRLADSDGNSTFASSVNQSSTEFETVRSTKFESVSTSTGFSLKKSADTVYRRTKNNSLNVDQPRAHNGHDTTARPIDYDKNHDGISAHRSAPAIEKFQIRKMLQIQSFSCVGLSYADIWAMDWGIPYSQIDAPVIIVIEIIFTFFVTGVVLLNGPFRSDYVDVIEKVAHIVSCALSAIFTGHMISSIKTTWKRNELMLIVPIQWKIAMFIMFMLTFVFVAEIFYSKFLFVNFELRKVFGEYDLVKAQETAEGDRSNVIPFGRKQLRSETIVSSDD